MGDLSRKIDEAKAACQQAYAKIMDVFDSLKESISDLNNPLPPPIHASTPSKKETTPSKKDDEQTSDGSVTFYERSAEFEPGAGQMWNELDLNLSSNEAQVEVQPKPKHSFAEKSSTVRVPSPGSVDSKPYWVPKPKHSVAEKSSTVRVRVPSPSSVDSKPYWVPQKKKNLNSSYDKRPYTLSKKNLKRLRGKARKCVEGHTCDSCSRCLAALSMSAADIQAVTRHRGPQPPKTPPGYWDPAWRSPPPPA